MSVCDRCYSVGATPAQRSSSQHFFFCMLPPSFSFAAFLSSLLHFNESKSMVSIQQALRLCLQNQEPAVLPSTLGRQAGHGLFAERRYRRGETITAYGGRLLPFDDAMRLPCTTHVRGLEHGLRVIDGASGFGRARDDQDTNTIHGLGSLCNTLWSAE